jgi:outer membrane protein OmpU
MKKTLLLGTTALIAACVVTSGALQAAEEPITASVGGYFRSAMGFINQDNADGEFANGNLSTALGNNVELSVSGSTTLDNGITAGFNAQLDPAGMDERHVFFRGSFGQIQVGQHESARQQMTNFAPSGNYNFGVNTPFFIFGNPGNTAFLPFANVRTYDDGLGDEDNLKLIYFSPTFNGFRLGMSYAPDDAVAGQYGSNTTDGLGALQNNASISAEFSNNFGDFSIRVMAGYETYKLETCNVNAAGTGVVASFTLPDLPATATPPIIRTTADQNCDDDPDSIQFGGTVSFGEFSIGGGYLETAQIGNTGTGDAANHTHHSRSELR